jgi:hypothetical protein
MANETLSKLRNLAKQMPAMDAQAAARAKAAQETQFQAALAATPATAPIEQTAQQLGAAQTTAQGQVAAQQAAQAGSRASQLGQAVLQEQKFQAGSELQKQERTQGLALGNAARQQALAGQEADIASRKQITSAEIEQAKRLQALGIDYDTRLNVLSLKQREDVSKLGRDVKAKLFDDQLVFEKDDRGRLFSNERQLADYAIASAKSDIDLQDKMREMTQDAEKDMIMLEATNAKLKQALEQGYLDNKQKLDQDTKRRIQKAIDANENEMRKKASNAANRALIFQGLGAVAGAGIGFATLGPMGAMAGAQLGSEAGKTAAGATAK